MKDIEMKIAQALTTFIELMHLGEYFEAHEALEEVWHPLRRSGDVRRNIIRGYINAAVSLEHIKRGKGDIKTKALAAMSAYERHKDSHHHEELSPLFKEMERLVERMKGEHPHIFVVSQ